MVGCIDDLPVVGNSFRFCKSSLHENSGKGRK
jgi:hypothetical protein